MNYKLNLFFVLMMLLISPLSPVFSDNEDQIMSADIPYKYGEQAFIERINEKAQGRRPVGLVLSGGSARAFAHIGVLKRLEELNIIPDFIVANSMGSIVGLLYGAGFSPDQISEIIETTNLSELFRMTLPLKGGVIDVEKFSGMLHNFTGEIDVSELPIPVMVLCEDLITKRQVWIAEGNIITVMKAAYALPLYFNPVEYREHLLIDGGIANLVPLDCAYMYSDTVIASTAFYQNPKLNLKNPITNINVALDIGKSRTGISQIKQYKPLLIRCDVESFSFMEFGSLPEIQAAGYDSADTMKAQLLDLSSSGMTRDLIDFREQNRVKIDLVLEYYLYQQSIPVLNPTLLLTTKLELFNNPGSDRYLNNDLFAGAGADFSQLYFSSGLFAGIGADLSGFDGFFPVIDSFLSWDLSHFIRFNLVYSINLSTDGLTDSTNAAGLFSSSDVFAGLRFIPLAATHFKLGFLASGEMSLSGINALEASLITVQAEFAAASDPRSEHNYTASLSGGTQFYESGGIFSVDHVSVFADLEFSLPFPGTGGLLKWDNRGFVRHAVTGNAVNYYLRDGMRVSMNETEAAAVKFVETGLIFNPHGFNPAFSEFFMFKEIELGIFTDIGWIDAFLWSSGLSLSMDISLLGLKPLRLSSYAAFDSLSGGITGGITLIP
jgi:NTE family protein